MMDRLRDESRYTWTSDMIGEVAQAVGNKREKLDKEK